MIKTRGMRILGRMAQAVPVLAGVVVVSFVLTRALPEDPVAYFAGSVADASSIEEIRKAIRFYVLQLD